MKLKQFTVNVRVNAVVSINIDADSLETALAKAREQIKNTAFISDEVEYVDGNQRIIGVDAGWDLE